jgi:Uncharacterized conserved protein
MSEREKILGRIRDALVVKAPFPGNHGHDSRGGSSVVPPSSRAGEWLPRVDDSPDGQLAAFATNCVDLKADFFLLNSADEVKAQLQKLAAADGWKKIATHSGVLTDSIVPSLNLTTLRADAGYDVHEMESCDAGITECDALIAQTGSVLVTNRSCGGRALSVLPPHHVVLARRDQLLRDLPAAFQLLKRKYAGNYPSMISFVTGPSRTGDIERILVLGAHGPKRLTIFVF